MNWTPLFPLADLAPGHTKARGGVLVVHTADGRLFATENACPHQGYPLAQGALNGCTLTCTWHNFKFDVATGRAVVGEEAVVTHPVRVNDGIIEVQRRREIDIAAVWASLGEAMSRVQSGRISREVARLLGAGVPAAELIAWGGAWDADRGEYGPSHTAALGASLLGWRDSPPAPGTDPRAHRVQLVVETLDLGARAVVGMPLRSRPEPEKPGVDAVSLLRARVEAEDAAGAEALVRGMVAAGWTRDALARAFYPLVTDHFLDFGHQLIYVHRVLSLAHAAPQHADALLGGLIFGIVCGTREDLLPPWAGFRGRWKAFVAAGGPAMAWAVPPASGDRAALHAALVEGSVAEAFDTAKDALLRGELHTLLDALVLAGATRLLRFDAHIDADPTVEEGWLDATHRLTVASAVREAVASWPEPEVLRLVLLAVHFVALARALDAASSEAPPDPPPVEVLRARALSDRSGRAIFFAHDVKTLATAEAEATRLGDPLPLHAVARFLMSPVRERSIGRLAHEAIRLVEDGKPPRSAADHA